MHEVTAYVPEDDDRQLYRTEKGARLHELRALLRAATQSMPVNDGVTPRSDNSCEFLLTMLTSQTYPTVVDKLLEAVAYFQKYRGVLRGPGFGN